MAAPERGCAGLPRASAAQRCSVSTFEWLEPRSDPARLGEELRLRKDHRTVAFSREYGLICTSPPCSPKSYCVTGRPSLHGHCSSSPPYGPGRRVASDVRSAADHGGAGIGGDDDGAARPREITSPSGAATRHSQGPDRQPPNVVVRSSIDSDKRTRVQDPRITSLPYKRYAIRSRS